MAEDAVITELLSDKGLLPDAPRALSAVVFAFSEEERPAVQRIQRDLLAPDELSAFSRSVIARLTKLDRATIEERMGDLLDDINTDVMTPAWVCFRHLPDEIALDAYAGLVDADGEAQAAGSAGRGLEPPQQRQVEVAGERGNPAPAAAAAPRGLRLGTLHGLYQGRSQTIPAADDAQPHAVLEAARALLAQEGVRHLDQDARAVTRTRICAHGAAMGQPGERGDQVGDALPEEGMIVDDEDALAHDPQGRKLQAGHRRRAGDRRRSD